MATPHVICVGMAVIDLVFGLDQLPLHAGKHFAHNYQEIGGGIAANGAVTVCQLGGRATLWGRLGTDALGQRIAAELNSYGVDTSAVQFQDNCHSPLSAVMLDSAGERMLVNYSDPKLYQASHGLDLSALQSAHAVLADLRWSAASRAVLQAAREACVPALLDYDQNPEHDTADLIALASHVVFGREALADFSATDDPQRGLHYAAQHTDAALAVTLGGEGLLSLQEGQIHHLPAFAIKAVDTLAAGDVLHGALALALAEQQPFADALRFASAAAAIKCTRFGGRLGIPKRAEIEQFLRTES